MTAGIAQDSATALAAAEAPQRARPRRRAAGAPAVTGAAPLPSAADIAGMLAARIDQLVADLLPEGRAVGRAMNGAVAASPVTPATSDEEDAILAKGGQVRRLVWRPA
jgi:hypothetical protein